MFIWQVSIFDILVLSLTESCHSNVYFYINKYLYFAFRCIHYNYIFIMQKFNSQYYFFPILIYNDYDYCYNDYYY